MEIVDEMYSLCQDVMRFNQRVDTYRHQVIHYNTLVDMTGEKVVPAPEDLPKISLKLKDVGFATMDNFLTIL